MSVKKILKAHPDLKEFTLELAKAQLLKARRRGREESVQFWQKKINEIEAGEQ